MNDGSNSLKRNHFRAAVSVGIRAQVFEEGKGGLSGNAPGLLLPPETISTGEPQVDRILSTFTAALLLLDEKLNRILEKLEGAEKTGREIQVIDTVDISGSGICLVLPENPETGTVLKLSILLPGFPYGRLETLGRVVRSEVRREGDKTTYLAGIEFTGLSEEERERLIQFTFGQQRKQIRASGNGD